MDPFETATNRLAPLPERMRPTTLEQYVGQRHLVGEGCILRRMIESGVLSSFILWGPPGVGKTTLARIIAHTLDREFYTLSAVSAGVKDVREVLGILDLQLNCSYGTEASSLSLIEGMSLGLPTVASDYGGNFFFNDAASSEIYT